MVSLFITYGDGLEIHHLDPTVYPTNRIPHAQPIDPARAPTPPVRPHAARSTSQLLTPRIPTSRRPTLHFPTSCPCLLHPTPPLPVSTASCYASRHHTTGKHPYLPLPSPILPAPLPPSPRASPPASAASSYAQRLSHRRPCLCSCVSQND
jgi:hypothetical protein